MTKSHGRRSRARNRSRRSGVAYAAANAGTLHAHASSPSATDLQPDPGRWGVETVPDLRTAAALIGASIERCAPCRQSLTAKLLEEDPIVLAVTAGAAYRLRAAREVEGEVPADGPAQVFSFLAQHARAHGATPDCCSRESSGCPQPAAWRSWTLRWAYSFLTRVAGETRTALTLLRTSVEGLRDRELQRDETLDEAIQRYTGASVTAEQLAGVLGRAYSAVGHLAYKEAPSGQESAVRG